MGIMESSGVAFTMFQLKGAAYQWVVWPRQLHSPGISFSEMFMREFVPQSLRDAWRVEFEQLRQGSMTVSEYAVQFSDLSRHAPPLAATVRERVRRFIDWAQP
ncbi:uncharacterized protein [Nicotiana tomentosiformis]|uniref:uncharacterized protein n=1 Tax=Nicotiana tomentosiformis TaxID=4098 RepID=UPI00388C9274